MSFGTCMCMCMDMCMRMDMCMCMDMCMHMSMSMYMWMCMYTHTHTYTCFHTHVHERAGTGAVKITPAHDPNDFLAGRRHSLPETTVFTDDGKVASSCGDSPA